MQSVTAAFEALPMVAAGILASLIAGLAAGLGALPVYVTRHVSQKAQDVMLGGAAGLMLGATAFSLVLPGLEAASTGGSELLGGLVVGTGMMAGAVLLWLAHRMLPHEHFVKGVEDHHHGPRVKRVWLFVIAITLHNFPEGLAVGVGFAGGDVGNGLAVTTAIFLQNLPEGFAVALALVTLNWRPGPAVLLALGTGAVETVGGFVGAGVVALSAAALPWALAAAAGAMLFVISHEVIPETHRNGHETAATFGVMGGFVVMMILDTALA